MRYFILPKQKLCWTVLFTVLLGCLTTLAAADNRMPLLERQLTGFYSGIYLDSTFAFLFALLPFFMIVIMASDLMERDFPLVSCYCFTRMKRREKWYLHKLLSVSLLTFFDVLGYRLSGLAVSQAMHPESWSAWEPTVAPNLHVFLFAWLFVLCMAVAVNVFSLLCSVKWMVVGGFALSAVCSVWAELQLKTTAALWWLNPVLHFGLLAHPSAGICLSEGIELPQIPQMAIWKTYLFFGAVLLGLIMAGFLVIRRIDPGLIKEES